MNRSDMPARTGGADPVLAARVVEFVRWLRDNHFCVGIREAIDALEVAACLNIADRARLYWGLRALLCSNAAEWSQFERLFEQYWQGPKRSGIEAGTSALAGRSARAREDLSAGRDSTQASAQDGSRRRAVGASAREASVSDFRLAQLNQDDEPLQRWIEDLARRMRRRLLRRHRVRSRGCQIHVRRSLRRSLRYGGLPLNLVFRQRRRELPRLVLITDVSRSMNIYSYFFLRFARGVVGAFKRSDAFVFHTRLVHATDALRERDRHRLKEKLAWIAAGWGGGTRIGESLRAFNAEYARRLVDSRTFVFIVSDGYDTGAPELLGEQVRRLRERARRVIWLNPLLGRPDYTPTAGGMQAALPHVDRFASAHDVQSLMKIERMLTQL